ncbi:MAG: DNA cytosine methyltransferase, partial [Candidatus Omnitrophica bacterium]|nr:DNA cytosine methyltransferase [Candidatus Omnitrophota bacterium]
ITKEIKPKFFIFENVKTFLATICTDIDNKDKSIKEAIELNLAGEYNISYQVINFKDYGSPSSRTRTLVTGVRKDTLEVTPYDILPDFQKERTLKDIIGDLSPLKEMGEIDPEDIYHHFRPYNKEMLEWIRDIKEGESAFDNKDSKKIPQKLVDGKVVYNQNKNGDKYTRCYWGKPGPCIHTRNDILASQNTIHPRDNRVFSVRELMKLMSIPNSFKWSDVSEESLNKLPLVEKRRFLAKEEMNIRSSIGEAVPTIIFQRIAVKIKNIISNKPQKDADVGKIVLKHSLDDPDKLNGYLRTNVEKFEYSVLSKIAELANSQRQDNAAYYTRQDVCYSIVKDLPEANKFKKLRILEPSIGVGNFLPLLIRKYKDVPIVIIDVVDKDKNSISTLKTLLRSLDIPDNFHINYIVDDFLFCELKERYDIVVGNPPFKKITNNKETLSQYKSTVYNKETNNIYSFFIEKALLLGDIVALVVPKSLINAPEFNKTRELLAKQRFSKITDYGEAGFNGVKIETISFILETKKKLDSEENLVKVDSYITKMISFKRQAYMFDTSFPYWLIYRDQFFDKISEKLKFNIFTAFRDRQVTKKITCRNGRIRVLKSRNIASNTILNIKGYDCFIDEVTNLTVGKYLNNTDAVLVPNLTYKPRACFMPQNVITDGSVAILTLRNGSRKVTRADLEYYGSKEFERFYAVARNLGTRSLNIDNNSVFFFGILKEGVT